MIATVEKTAAKLPPSERDFQVFRFVRVETNSTRAAAQVFEISQTRVRQVVSRVVEYLLAVAREGLEEDEEEQAGSLSVAEQIARMQLEHLYSQAMQSWNDSQRPNGLGQASLGQTRYLSLAARISLLMSKVPMHAPPRSREDVEEEEFDVRSSAAPEPAPPAEDCSPPALSRPVCEPPCPPAVAASAGNSASYKLLAEIRNAARRSFLRPAQAQIATVNDSPERGESTEESLSPERVQRLPLDHVRRPLSRRERRARQRELERRLKKR
jgi:hypothetical protein